MQLASGTHIPDGLLAANVLLSERPRHGVASKNAALNPGIDEANSTVAIGLRAGLLLNRVESRYTGKERDIESGLDYFGATRQFALRLHRTDSGNFRKHRFSSRGNTAEKCSYRSRNSVLSDVT